MTRAAALLAVLVGLAPAAPPEEPPADLTPLESRALAHVLASLPQRTVPTVSPALVQAARRLARSAASGDRHPISTSALRAALEAAGVHDPAPAAVILSAPPPSLPDALAAAARFRGASHLGVGVALRDGTAWAVLVATERRAELDPFPRRVEPGASALLRGRLLRLEGPRVWVASPSGAVHEPVVAVEGDRFSAAVRFDVPGTYRVEVGGTGPRGPTMAALLDVACGPPDAAPRPAAGEGDPVDAPARILAEVNALRERQGLPPLTTSPALDAVALAHSQAMRAASTLAHRLDGGPDLAGRLAAAGLPYRSGRENVARGDDALDAHRATVESPAHLANLLAPDVSRMGLGIARGTLPGGQPVAYLTEVLIEPRGSLPPAASPTVDADPADVDARILAEVNALREREGLGALRRSPELDAVALRHSEAMLAASTLAHRLDGGPDFAGRLAAARIPYRSGRENVARGHVALDAHRVTIESPAHLANLLDPDVSLLGLGIARGTLPGGEPVVYLTEILLDPRGNFPSAGSPTGVR